MKPYSCVVVLDPDRMQGQTSVGMWSGPLRDVPLDWLELHRFSACRTLVGLVAHLAETHGTTTFTLDTTVYAYMLKEKTR